MACVNTGIDTPKRKKRINLLFIGPAGLGKTLFLNEIADMVPNSTSESCQSSSGLALTAMVTNEEDTKIIHYGPIARCHGSICCLNEANQLRTEGQSQLFDAMQEGTISLNKYNVNAKLPASTTIVASANPRGTNWDEDMPLLEQINILPQVLDRFDLKFILRNNKDANTIRQYADLKSIQIIEEDDSQVQQEQLDKKLFLRKYLMYAKQLKPKFTQEAVLLLKEYEISLELTNNLSKRPFETVYNCAYARAKLKLKDEVDIKDAQETIKYYTNVTEDYYHAVGVRTTQCQRCDY